MYQKSVAGTVLFKAIDTADGISGKAGITVWSVKNIIKDGAAPTALINAPTACGDGWYVVSLTSSEMNADSVGLDIQAANAAIAPIIIHTEANYTSDRAVSIDSLLLYASRTVGRGTVAAGATTTTFTASTCSPAGAVADQFKRRVILFDSATATAALRGVITVVQTSSNASLPAFTLDPALPTPPATGDSFNIL